MVESTSKLPSEAPHDEGQPARRGAGPEFTPEPAFVPMADTFVASETLLRTLPVTVSSAGVEELGAGAQIGRYLVIRRLGAGAMGVVYAAYDPKLDRKVALKLLAELATEGTEDARQRLQREAQALAKLAHPNVVGVYDVDTHDRHLYVAMEFVAGRTLGAWMRERPRSWRAVLELFVAAGRGLAAAHAAGLIHRDFKPENVMVDAAGHARVIDFGLALAGELDASSRDELGTRATSTGLIRGTPGYMAPEISQGLPRAASDQFAFAVVVREALTGRHPFREGLRGEPARGGEATFAKLRALIDRAMSPSPDDRFASVDELCDALAAKLVRKPGGVREPSEARRSSTRAALGLGLLGLLGVAATSVALLDLEWPWLAAPTPTPSEAPAPREAAPAPSEPPPDGSCEALREWAGTWQLGGKVLWTEYAYQLDWWLGYELELELRPACELAVVARRYRPLVVGEPRGEPVVTTSAAVAVYDGTGAWQLPLELGFAGDTNTYGNDEHYRIALRLDHVDGAPRVSGGFARFDSKGYPIRTGKLLGSSEHTPTLAQLDALALDCAARCRSACAGERAVQACIADGCAGADEPCGPPSVDFKPPLRANAAKRTLQRGESLVEQSLASGGAKATLLSICTANARALAGGWTVEWSDANAASGRIALELSASGCTLSGTATGDEGSTAIRGEVTPAGTWSIVPSEPTPALPATLVLVGVGPAAPALGIDMSEATRELRAYRRRGT